MNTCQNYMHKGNDAEGEFPVEVNDRWWWMCATCHTRVVMEKVRGDVLLARYAKLWKEQIVSQALYGMSIIKVRDVFPVPSW